MYGYNETLVSLILFMDNVSLLSALNSSRRVSPGTHNSSASWRTAGWSVPSSG